MKIRAALLFAIILLMPAASLLAQANTGAQMDSVQFDMSGFPQWAKDLRRGEIVAFGSFPFAYFFTNFGVDMFRFANNGWDRRYAPWPFDAAGSVGKTQKERIMTLGIAAGSAVLIAIVDFGIERGRRSKREGESRRLPEGTPIIIRKPLYGENEAGPPENDNLPPGTGNP